MTWEARPRHIKVAREVLEKCLFFSLVHWWEIIAQAHQRWWSLHFSCTSAVFLECRMCFRSLPFFTYRMEACLGIWESRHRVTRSRYMYYLKWHPKIKKTVARSNTFHQGVLGWLSLGFRVHQGKWFRKIMLAGHEIFAWVQPLFVLFQSILVLCWSLVCSYSSINNLLFRRLNPFLFSLIHPLVGYI